MGRHSAPGGTLMVVRSKEEFGVLRRDGQIEGPFSEASCNEGYMTTAQYAKVRAEATGGQVVTRTITTTISKWETQ